MLVALLSDTHDDERQTQAALELLKARNPALYLHAGDMVSAGMLDLFAGLPLHFVFGNNEFDHAGLRARAEQLGLKCHGDLADLELAGKRIGMLHGHDGARLHSAARSGKYDYVIHGHTHVRADGRVMQGMKGTRVINPGAVHRAKVKSVAVLDLAGDRLEFVELAAV